jgi:TetR/AcrR family transcriptional regulator
MKTENIEISNEKTIEIIQAAQKRMMNYGFSKVTMDEIAEDIGMKKASLYYYFPTKEDIFRAVIKNEHLEFIKGVTALIEQPIPASDKLRKYVKQRIQHSGVLFTLSGAQQRQWISIRPTIVDLMTEFTEQNCAYVVRILEEGNRSGEFSIQAPADIARLILSVLQGLRMRLFKDHTTHTSQEIYNELEQQDMMFVETFLSGIQTRPVARK